MQEGGEGRSDIVPQGALSLSDPLSSVYLIRHEQENREREKDGGVHREREAETEQRDVTYWLSTGANGQSQSNF